MNSKVFKLFYQQHAGFINVELIKRQQKGINSRIEYLNEILKTKKIILNKKDYYYFTQRLNSLEQNFQQEKKKKKSSDKTKLDRIKDEKMSIFTNTIYQNSFKKLSSDVKGEIENEILELKKEYSLNKLKILSQQKNIKNFDDFFRYYINIDQELLKKYSEYLVKNIKFNQIKNKTELKESILYLRKILNYSGFYPLFNDKKIIDILKNKNIPDEPISVLKKKIIEIEKYINLYFSENKKQIVESNKAQDDELKEKIYMFELLLNTFNKYKLYYRINLQDVFENLENIFDSNQIEYSKEDFLITFVDEPFKYILETTCVNMFDLYRQGSMYFIKEKGLLNKKFIFDLNHNLNKLKLFLYFNIKKYFSYQIEYKYEINNINDFYNFLINEFDLDLINEIEFLKPLSQKFNNINDILYLLEFIKSKEYNDFNIVPNYNYPLNDQENELMIQGLDITKYSDDLLELSLSELIYEKKIGKEAAFEINKIKYYKLQKNMSYKERQKIFLEELINLQIALLNDIMIFEGNTREKDTKFKYPELYSLNSNMINIFDILSEDDEEYLLNECNMSEKFVNTKLINLTKKINYEIDKLEIERDNLKNIKSNLIKRKSALIYDSNKIKVYQPRNLEESIKYGQNTKWCTAAANDNMFCRYHKPNFNNLFIIIPNTNKKTKCFKTDQEGENIYNEETREFEFIDSPIKYQIDVIGLDLMNACDEPVKICDLIKEYPDLKYFLKPIKYYKYRC